ncbi:hypothetical protein BSS2_I0627 [Brucella suis bv. 1 str. S2]|uniref:Uncharacterized protein n=3 Tax=Brucella TaxID=234 RepID=Q2YMY2_BRUA2|nr:hypothetical protein BR0645 [Brucella suis 1330]AAX74037.1 hypothetical protein BruAb1_0662 [Brucella abortus bv. 1 str. 9-941]AEU05659.1 hypothetical protein BSVBI22_A0641 [Brucella suis VBI22]AHN46283.1 hypothetical protein BSS2_I0627 [Brucella suis bv. 1 str. S2]CAJ10621.1 conserved hypothetical protein [Brucella abortus 2308]CDL76048.1 unnamed protein product [Brucella canis str. Oliveri]SHO30471.1 predicted protein [Brucella abortus]
MQNISRMSESILNKNLWAKLKYALARLRKM